MRHPNIEDLYASSLANPFSPELRSFIGNLNLFHGPVRVYLPSGDAVTAKLRDDSGFMLPWARFNPISIRHQGKTFLVSALPLTPDRSDEVDLVAWDPRVLLTGPAATEPVYPGVTSQFMTRRQALRLLGEMTLPEDVNPSDLLTGAINNGRARTHGAFDQTIVLSPVPANREEKQPGMIRIDIWPPRGVRPDISFDAPRFRDIAAARIWDAKFGTRSTGVAIRIPHLDRVGRCLFVSDNHVHWLRNGIPGGAHSVRFGDLKDVGPTNEYQKHCVDTYRDISRSINSGRSFRDVTQPPLTNEDVDWAKERLAGIFAEIGEKTKDGRPCPFAQGWQAARSAAIARSHSGRQCGWFEGEGLSDARDRITNPEILADFDKFTGFWPSKRYVLAEYAWNANLNKVSEETFRPEL